MESYSSEDYCSPQQAATDLGVVDATVRQMINRGELSAVRVGKKLLRVRRSDVLALITPVMPVITP